MTVRMNGIHVTFLLLRFTISISSQEAYNQAAFKIIQNFGSNVIYEDVKRPGDLEYPRSNTNILRKVRALWEKYYECLELTVREERKPEIRRLQQGQYTEFPCRFCARPFQNYEELEWKYNQLRSKELCSETESLQNLVLKPGMVLTHNKTLKIYNAVESLEGLYACYRKDSVISVYVLQVSNNDTVEKDTAEIKTDNLERTNENGFRISYAWSEWTECNSCGRVGKKFKYGTCYVSLQQEIPENEFLYREKVTEKHNSQRSVTDFHRLVSSHGRSVKRKILNKLKARSPVSKDNKSGSCGAQILEKFSTGIPCASQYLPKEVSEAIGNVTAVKVLVKHCWEPCEKSEIFVVLDHTGKVIETANNSAGIYSMFQECPELPPEVKRRTLSEEFGKDIIIHCPGTSLTNTPAVWKVKNRILFPDVIANDSKGRITIDLFNRIHIRKLRLGDSHIYSCWHKTELVGTVNLIVEKKFSFRLNHHVILFLILTSLTIALLVGRKIITRELEKRNK